MEINSIKIDWLGHAAFRISTAEKIIYIDPYQLAPQQSTLKTKADLILITHSHYDHCSQQDIEKIIKENTIVICPADCQSKITRVNAKIELIEPTNQLEFFGIKIKGVAAYNINKKFHPKNECWLGYIIQLGSIIIYHAGDTDLIKEMSKLTGYAKKGQTFIALLPVGGTYTMDAKEAAEAVSMIKPNLVIPMHYGAIVGSKKDAEIFAELVKKQNIKIEILEKSN